ncbi:hypothetical protein Ancab_020724 [Ancistrocladus abbreviatus]
MKSKFYSMLLIELLSVQCLLVLTASQGFDFFYFVVQWPGSYCDTSQGCCYPTTGKPAADFSIHGLWPNYNDGSYPSNCDPNNPFDESLVSDLLSRMQAEWPSLSCPSSDDTSFWSHEWSKQGTCSESVLAEHDNFQAALNLRDQNNILQMLANAGIQPDGNVYSLTGIKDAIQQGVGYTPFVECNTDASGSSQLYQIYLCVDTSGSSLIECPVFPSGQCDPEIKFPSF